VSQLELLGTESLLIRRYLCCIRVRSHDRSRARRSKDKGGHRRSILRRRILPVTSSAERTHRSRTHRSARRMATCRCDTRTIVGVDEQRCPCDDGMGRPKMRGGSCQHRSAHEMCRRVADEPLRTLTSAIQNFIDNSFAG